MLKSEIIHPQVLKLLGELGHTDKITVADAGLPIPAGVERIELAWSPNEPKLVAVLRVLVENTVIQKAYIAEEIKSLGDSETYTCILKILEGIPIEYIPHSVFKQMTQDVKGVIRTGEFSPYPNVILECGCRF